MNKIDHIQKHRPNCIGRAVEIILSFESDDDLIHYLFDCDGYLDIYRDDSIWPVDYENTPAEDNAELQVWVDGANMCDRPALYNRLVNIQANGL